MRKYVQFFSFLGLIAILFTLGSCKSSAVDTAGLSFTAGTYSATASGNNGPVSVSVTFSRNAILDIKVTESKETEGLGVVAIEKLIGQIKNNQTLAIDSVSGATISSAALLQAVSGCVTQAGGSISALQANKPTPPAPKTETLEADVVIVGAGGSGMTAASRASRAGLNVILLEKMAFTGGATMIAGGQMVTVGSNWQKSNGVTNDTPQSMIQDFLVNGSNLNYLPLLTLYANNVGTTVDWLQETVGMKYTNAGVLYAPEYAHNRLGEFLGGAAGLGKTLLEGVRATSTRLLLETRAESLIIENGSVSGVTAKGSNGTTYTIRAKAVLLTTGGFGNNVDMLPAGLKSVLYYGPMSSTGDGHRMAQDVRAKFHLMEYGKMYPNGIEIAPRIAKSTIFGNYASFNVSSILVNKEGNRVVNERASNRTVLNAQLAQGEKTLYLVMDAASFDAFRNNLSANSITQDNINGWLANNGKVLPLFAHGTTVDEAASAAGINAANLKTAISRYNSFVRQGRDDDFGRQSEFLKAEIGVGPYYIVEQKPRFATTMGGVVVNTSMQVTREDGSVIPNLYAAGELAGGIMGDDSPSGANVGWALTSGRLAADAIISVLKK
jgi:fumarate reductase flavoprotein subunit